MLRSMELSILNLVLFAVGSAAIFAISRRSLSQPRSHGFYRFFAFEILLVLILLNRVHWFRTPFSPFQIISWVLLLASLALAVHGFNMLRVAGKPVGGFEQTTRLVVRGIYRYIRHPMYASLVWLGWGVFFKDPSLVAGLLAGGATVFLAATARVEEAENLQRFGVEYAAYMQSTRRFIPFLF